MSRIDTVVFDLGQVLIPWDPRKLYQKLFNDEAEMERFLADVCHPDWNTQQDAGRPLAEATAERIAAFPQFEALIRAYYGRWEEMLGEAVEGSVQLLKELKAKGYRVLAITNWSSETFRQVRPLYPFLDEFEGIVVSGDELLIKPDQAIFRLFCERYAVKPEQAVFLDDNPHNVEGARAIGMRGILFQSPEQAREALEKMGICA